MSADGACDEWHDARCLAGALSGSTAQLCMLGFHTLINLGLMCMIRHRTALSTFVLQQQQQQQHASTCAAQRTVQCAVVCWYNFTAPIL